MKYFLGCLIMLVDVPAIAQSSLTKILSAPVYDQDYLIALKQQEFIENHKFNSPWFRKLELRMQSEDSRPDIDEYRMRLGLLNPMEAFANKKYKKLIAGYNEAERESIVNDVLQMRYGLLIEYYYLGKKISLTNELIGKKGKQQEIGLELNPDLDDLVNLEKRILSEKIGLIDLRNKHKMIGDEILRFSGLLPADPYTRLISPVLIMTRTDTSFAGSSALAKTQIDLAIKEQLLRVSKAESFSNIGFFQGDYDVEQGNTFSDHIGFRMGVSVPIFNPDRPKLQRNQLELIDDRVKNDMLLEEVKNQILKISEKITSAYQQLMLLEESKAKLAYWEELRDELNVNQSAYNEISNFEYFVRNKELMLHAEMLNLYVSLLHKKNELFNGAPVNQILEEAELLQIR